MSESNPDGRLRMYPDDYEKKNEDPGQTAGRRRRRKKKHEQGLTPDPA